MNLELQGKVAIVTDGSLGIRRAVAATLAKEGAVTPPLY
jgi:NAD(P)-dependent dehydrogenase (short-subunit alcohol dehydrogenase family)